MVCTVLVNFAGSPEAIAQFSKVLSTVCAIQIIVVTQILIYWRFHRKQEGNPNISLISIEDSDTTKTGSVDNKNIYENEADQVLAKQIQQVLEQQNMYLQANLKVADLARHMSVSEYRISRVFRHHFNARNFNQFINEMRINHAKTLLKNTENIQWPILVVGLESGFASVGPFTRAFKSSCDMTPNQYRQFHQSGINKTLSTATEK
jgi:AraC-like DNA-binding protein